VQEMTVMSGLLPNVMLGREVVFLNCKSGHNPESRIAEIWGVILSACVSTEEGAYKFVFILRDPWLVEGKFALRTRSGGIRDKFFQEVLHGHRPNEFVAYVERHVNVAF